MRKIKKINGYLIVKFNDRELREWDGTGLGTYGVIDAELYTGTLEVDRSVMEYDDADCLEVAVEQARGLESELDVAEEKPTFTVIKETDEAVTEDEIEDPQLMIAGWKSSLERQVTSKRYPDIDPRTAAHELYGYMVAFKQLGLIEVADCYVEPDTFGTSGERVSAAQESLLAAICDDVCGKGAGLTQEELDAVCDECVVNSIGSTPAAFAHLAEKSMMQRVYDLGLALEADCPQDDCVIYLNIFRMCRELDEQIDLVTGRAQQLLERELRKLYSELEGMLLTNYAVRKYRRKAKEPPEENRTAPGEDGLHPDLAEHLREHTQISRFFAEVEDCVSDSFRDHTLR